MIKSCILFFFLAAATSCASISKQTNKIRPGYTKEQVESIAGKPEDVQFKGKDEAWQYCVTNFGVNNFSIVWFKDEKVTGLTFYKNHGNPGSLCSSHFEPIKWESAPDSIVEIRNR